MKFLGWLKGKGFIMAGLIGAVMLASPGCSSSGKEAVDTSEGDVRIFDNAVYGIWDQGGQEEIAPAEVFPVYGIDWSPQEEVEEPVDVYGIWPADTKDQQEPEEEVFPVYGIWDALEETGGGGDEVMDMYGIWEDAGSKADKKGEVEPNPEVYGIWPADTTD